MASSTSHKRLKQDGGGMKNLRAGGVCESVPSLRRILPSEHLLRVSGGFPAMNSRTLAPRTQPRIEHFPPKLHSHKLWAVQKGELHAQKAVFLQDVHSRIEGLVR
jgi:hypothetical protein